MSASTQNQAFNALVFVFKQVLERELGDLADTARAERRRKLPVVLTREEVRRVLEQLSNEQRLIVKLLYGSGLRLLECLRLRVKDVDFGYGQITVRDGKGGKDRIVPLPQSARGELQEGLPQPLGQLARHRDHRRLRIRRCGRMGAEWLRLSAFTQQVQGPAGCEAAQQRPPARHALRAVQMEGVQQRLLHSVFRISRVP